MKHLSRLGMLALATLTIAGAAAAQRVETTGFLGGTGAVSWHPMTLHAGHRYRFAAAGQAAPLHLGLRLSLGSAILKEKRGDSGEVRMAFQPPASGIYWLRVLSLEGQGEFGLTIDEVR